MAARVVPLDDGSRTMVSDVAKFLNTMASVCQVVTNDSNSFLTAIRRFHRSHNLQRTSPQELAATMHTWYVDMLIFTNSRPKSHTGCQLI